MFFIAQKYGSENEKTVCESAEPEWQITKYI